MNRQELMLATLSAGAHEEFSPVQLQKLLFLVDRNVGSRLGGPHFDFQPYDYGPFDAAVYLEFERLAALGLGGIIGEGSNRRYRLNAEGRTRGREILNAMDPSVSKYVEELAIYVQRLSFSALVSSIYRAFPEMKAKSVFRG